MPTTRGEALVLVCSVHATVSAVETIAPERRPSVAQEGSKTMVPILELFESHLAVIDLQR